MSKYKYHINNLDCANCARKIENYLNSEKNFNNVIVNFNTLTLTYESDVDISINELNKMIQRIEPSASISKNEITAKKEFHLSILLIAIVISIIGYYLPIGDDFKKIFYLITYIMLLYRTAINAFKLLLKEARINENALITISCIGAFIIGEVFEGIMVITLYSIGKILESKAVDNSRRSVSNLLNIKAIMANKKNGKKIVSILVEDINIGDILVVKKGDKIPTDGVVLNGHSFLDMKALTGEVSLKEVSCNDSVLSGSINVGDAIEIKACSLYKDSTVAKILDLLEAATDKKTKTETIVDRISRIYTPLVLILAILMVLILPLFGVNLTDAIYRGLTFLVISCPCAIAISVPLAYFSGIGVASKNGILIKGSNYLDGLSHITDIIFDKTGTITNGIFKVDDIVINDSNYSYDEVLDILLKGESLSNHPIAKSITFLNDNKVDNSKVKKFKEITGMGLSFELDDKKVLIGNSKLCGCSSEGSIHLNINSMHVASIFISDDIKDGVSLAIDDLKKLGINIHMFTGDRKDFALKIARKLNIDDVKYEMLPTDKYFSYEKIKNSNNLCAFVGDGINDAPVLKRADLGISMGAVGSDVAIEASDIVIVDDDIRKIYVSILISKYTNRIIKENLIGAISIKILILLLSVFGLANMWLAVFADTGLTLLTILNTLRIIKKY